MHINKKHSIVDAESRSLTERKQGSYDVYIQPKPITLHIGFEWAKGGMTKKDSLWQFLRDTTERVIDEANKRSKSHQGVNKLTIRYGRLRVRHGGILMVNIRKRIKDADILLFDISNANANVYIECGIALAFHGLDSGRLFIFIDESKRDTIPSDLQGYFYTYYSVKGEKRHLSDARGFRAALRTAILGNARERGMWADKGCEEENAEL